MRLRSFLGFCLLVAALVNSSASAQQYPNQSITLIVPYSAGGITDVSARLYAEIVSRNIGQTIIIDNRPTGNGSVAASAVQNAKPDGYTLLIFSAAQLATVAAMQRVSYDPVKGFAPVTILFNGGNFLAIPFNSPAMSVAELLEYGKRKPGGLSFGTLGAGSQAHLVGAQIAAATHTPMEFVHYRGAAQMMPDLVSGRLDVGFAAYPAAGPFFIAKTLKALAIDAGQRLAVMPEAPTLTELGFGVTKIKIGPDWFGLAAPAGTPPQIIQKLRDIFAEASRDATLVRRLMESGIVVNTSAPEQMSRLMSEQWDATNQLIQAMGLRQQ